MNGWRARLFLLAIFFIAPWVHEFLTAEFPNTPEAMAVYHGTAGAVDWFLLYSAPRLISGRLCDDMQASCLASIVVNFAGFCAYMAYTPPVICNALIAGISYMQYLRILYVDRHDADYYSGAMVPGTYSVGT